MKAILKKHSEAVLIFLALIFLGITVGYYIWGIDTVVAVVDSSLKFTPSAQKVGFDLPSASSIDTRGLVP